MRGSRDSKYLHSLASASSDEPPATEWTLWMLTMLSVNIVIAEVVGVPSAVRMAQSSPANSGVVLLRTWSSVSIVLSVALAWWLPW